jgi:lysophospholipase L1-like esterase
MRLAKLVAGNLLVLFALFTVMELGYRIRRDGMPQAFVNLANYFLEVPYSNLGTGTWVVYDEVLGYRLNPASAGVNSLSVVGEEEVSIPKPAGQFRVLVLGDSVPFDDDGFPTLLRRKLQAEGDYDVINASVPGYTTYQELLFLQRDLLATTPDLVVLSYCLNDNHKFLHRLDGTGRLLWTQEAIDQFAINSPIDWLISRSYILSQIKLGAVTVSQRRTQEKTLFPWETTEDFSAAWKDESWSAAEGYLREMKATLARVGSQFAIVVIPYEPQLDDEALQANDDYVLKPQRSLKRICTDLDVPCLDLFEAFRSARAQGLGVFKGDGIHLTDAGHRFVADQLDRFLRANSLYASGQPRV